MYREIMDFFGRYGNLSDRKYSQLHQFLQNICVWKLDKPNTSIYYDTGLYTVTQFILNSVQAMSKTYPNILLNDIGFYRATPIHWGFSERHYAIIHDFINKYYQKLEEFKQDKVLYLLLQDIAPRLTTLNLFLQNLPIHTDIVKDFGDNVEGEPIRHFYHFMDKPTIYLLFSYCFYSVLYEYIISTNNIELLRTDVELIKVNKRLEIKTINNPSAQINGLPINLSEDFIEREQDINDIDIQVGNTQELKFRVAALLLSFLDVEEDNKQTIDMSYDDIQLKVRRNKDIERRSVIDRLTKMSIEQRKVEDSLKKYRLEHWNVGQQKGLFLYDAANFDREIDNMFLGQPDTNIDTNIDAMDINQLDAMDIIEQNELDLIQYNRSDINIQGIDMENGIYDADYYYNDEEPDEFDYTD
jgi:hypothetical protein